MKTRKKAKGVAKETSRSFSGVVGADIYKAWVLMLRKLVPDGRTHRLAVMVAGMLQYAVAVAAAKNTKDRHEGSLAFSLLEASDVNDPSEVEELIHDATVQLFKDGQGRV